MPRVPSSEPVRLPPREARVEDNPWHPVFLFLALMVAVVTPGCLGDPPGRLTIATTWPASERARVETEFRRWVGSNNVSATLDWVLLAPGDDLESVARHRRSPDVLLGGPEPLYARLAAAGLLQDGSWKPVGYGRPVESRWRGGLPDIVLRADPRRDASLLGELRAFLEQRGWPGWGWPKFYKWLVGVVGRRVFDPDFRARPADGVAALAGTRNPEGARGFLRFLGDSGRLLLSDPSPARAVSPEADALLADLLGATMVDARPELEAAWAALDRAGNPERATMWMTASPPWPPASVARFLNRESNAMPLIETLAAQLAPDPDLRAWLLRSWLAPARTVNGALLDELAGAADGRLAREPRFRAWLRSEWTAWARQRYRRVARLTLTPAGAKQP